MIKKTFIIFLVIFISILNAASPKNMILFFINGVDSASLGLARMALVGPYGKLAVEELNKGGYLANYSFSSWVSDNASALSTISIGKRTNNGEIGIDSMGLIKPTLLEIAKKRGKAIGIVTDSRLTYAPVASFYSHSANRYKETNFAEQLIKLEPQVAFGGGLYPFIPKSNGGLRKDGRDLLIELKNKGYKVLRDRLSIVKCSNLSAKTIGIFNHEHLSFEVDRNPKEPSFFLIVDKALKLLKNPANKNGFLLVIVSERLADALRNHDVKAFIKQFEIINKIFEMLISYQRLSKNTFLAVVSPYSTNPPFLSERMNLPYLTEIKSSTEMMAVKIGVAGDNLGWVLERYANLKKLTKKENEHIFRYIKNNKMLATAIGDVIANRLGIYFPDIDIIKNLGETYGNCAQVTPYFVVGPGSDKFSFYTANYKIGKIFSTLLNGE